MVVNKLFDFLHEMHPGVEDRNAFLGSLCSCNIELLLSFIVFVVIKELRKCIFLIITLVLRNYIKVLCLHSYGADRYIAIAGIRSQYGDFSSDFL
jgi:hypothetical protein